jgi:hypothetical protein
MSLLSDPLAKASGNLASGNLASGNLAGGNLLGKEAPASPVYLRKSSAFPAVVYSCGGYAARAPGQTSGGEAAGSFQETHGKAQLFRK